jgi:hypothetical protein
VNRLVASLARRPDVVELAVRDELAPFSLFRDALGDDLLDHPEQKSLSSNSDLTHTLDQTYLPRITAVGWQQALDAGEPDSAHLHRWWTVMIAAPSGDRGLTLPEDSSEAGLISLFSGPLDHARTIAYDPAQAVLIDIAVKDHCSPPAVGLCAPGVCGGCHRSTIYGSTGAVIACRCDDQRE